MWQYNYNTPSDELCHYGVLGMKWGVRRGSRLYLNGKTDSDVHKGRKKLEKNRVKILKKISKIEKKNAKLLRKAQSERSKPVDKNYKKINSIQNKIKKNNKLKSTFETGITKIDDTFVKKGQDIVTNSKVKDYSLKHLQNKKLSQLSNDELRDLNTRRALEAQYSKLNPSTIKKGLEMADSVSKAANTISNLYESIDKLSKVGKKSSK